jgi:glycogen synthase
LRIAYISYEYPPDTAFGGIATYVRQAAVLLAHRGHSVEVFAASGLRGGYFEDGKIGVNLVEEMDRTKFGEAILRIFSERNKTSKFDVVESPEFFADGMGIRKSYPRVAHVVKLHTPHELLGKVGALRPTISERLRHNYFQLRMVCGALRKLQRPARFQPHPACRKEPSPLIKLERAYACGCDLVVSPSQALADWAMREWSIAPSRIMVVPNPYVPSDELLNVPIKGNGKVVGFFGRLEQRKGVSDLIKAMPIILRAEPEARFRFVGAAGHYPGTGERFDIYLLRQLRHYRNAIEFVGACPLNQMPEQYGAVNVCVFPSIWENFPNVCLEAMAAGRAIVGSSAGGIAEMLENGVHGILIAPQNPKAIAEGVLRLLQSPELRQSLGASARKRLVTAYNVEMVGPQLERSFETAMSLINAKIS